MDSPKFPLIIFSFALFLAILSAAAHSDGSPFQITTDPLDQWETAMPSFYSGGGDDDDDDELGMDGQGIADSPPNRRSLFWKRVFRYYISYGALAANRIPCPPRSGRSYYTHNCYRASGPVHPYYRGCSAITRCRR